MIVITALCIIWVLFLCCCGYMLKRNQWVHDNRIDILHKSMGEYDQLPEYDEMMYKYWYIWNINKIPRKVK